MGLEINKVGYNPGATNPESTSTTTIKTGSCNSDSVYKNNSIKVSNAIKKCDKIQEFYNYTSQITNKLQGVMKNNGPTKSIADKISEKALSIVSDFMGQFDSLNQEKEKIVMENPKLSVDELKVKLRPVDEKIQALQNDAKQKLNTCLKIATVIPQFDSLVKRMQDKKIPTNEIMGFLETLVGSVDSSGQPNVNGKEQNVSKDSKNSKGSNFSPALQNILKAEQEKIKQEIETLENKKTNGSLSVENSSNIDKIQALKEELDILGSLSGSFSSDI